MIIVQQSVNPRFGADPVAQTVWTFIAPVARIESHGPAFPSAPANLDLRALYPALYAAVVRPSFLLRSARAVAFRLSVLGTAAALLTILHHS